MVISGYDMFFKSSKYQGNVFRLQVLNKEKAA